MKKVKITLKDPLKKENNFVSFFLPYTDLFHSTLCRSKFPHPLHQTKPTSYQMKGSSMQPRSNEPQGEAAGEGDAEAAAEVDGDAEGAGDGLLVMEIEGHAEPEGDAGRALRGSGGVAATVAHDRWQMSLDEGSGLWVHVNWGETHRFPAQSSRGFNREDKCFVKNAILFLCAPCCKKRNHTEY